jgi:CheY-like chemotaxis protein/anti-sigma regulatory factor (Ser/Thr protein kinase)
MQRIEASVAALDSLFGALLDISRLDAGVVEVRKQTFAIGPLLERICRDYEGEASAKGLTITRSASSARVNSDPILIERILRNLVSNAVRYTREGSVLIGCRRAGPGLRVEVWDTGIGIPAAYQQRIFEEYFQLENPERDRAKGLGLGLAIIRRLANLLQCELTLRSQPGKGSCFRVTLPLSADRGPSPEAAAEVEAMERGRGLLVVIDDEAAIREAMASLLQGWGYAVISAGSGEEMLTKLANHPTRPDLIISDYRLRGEETGIQAIARLQSEFNEAIPALLVTGDTAKDRLTEAQASGLVLLHKPVPNGKLRAAIVHLMAASREE